MKDKGQALVEYIFLLVVVAVLVMSVFNSQAFKNFFGESGTFAQEMKNVIEYSYRHASPGKAALGADENKVLYTDGTHPSYYNSGVSSSRFFGPAETYPDN